MRIDDWPATEGLNEVFRQIRDLDLERHVSELEAYGFTVVDAEHLGTPPGFGDRLLTAVCDAIERRTGVRPDLETGRSHPQMQRAFGLHHFYLLFEDQVFEEALLNPSLLLLVTYLLGEHCLLSGSNSILKGPNEVPNLLHHDTARIPDPLPFYSQVANATWLLTDYSRDNGALCFVPGSHRRCRQPLPHEVDPLENEEAVPIDAPAGSLVVWHGNTWHGAFTRANPGLRVSLALYFCRSYLQTQESYRENVPRAALDRHGERFATLMGKRTYYGWTAAGPRMEMPVPKDLDDKPLDPFKAGTTLYA